MGLANNDRCHQRTERFIVRAKATTYVGNGEHVTPYRTGSRDLRSVEGFGGHELNRRAQEIAYELYYHGGLIRV